MKNYIDFKLEDFVWDTYFRQWVLSPNREVNTFWENWLTENPSKKVLIEQAKQLVKALSVEEEVIDDEELTSFIDKTIAKIDIQTTSTTLIYKSFRFYKRHWMALAASIGVIIGTWMLYHTSHETVHIQTNYAYEAVIENHSNELIEVINDHENTLPVRLTDGSLVLLKKNSRVAYKKAFLGINREVYLSGEAFFEVTKNPKKPFLVYANGLVTKVLGTSFIIKAYDKDKEVTVEVKTGKVSVFAQSDAHIKEKATNRELEGVVLSPNQRIVYAKEAVRLTKSLVETPAIVKAENETIQFEFEDTPVSTVLKTIEKAYSIDIIFDEELLENCPLTASLTDLQLFEKLEIICKGVEARYEILDGQIVIYSKGCK